MQKFLFFIDPTEHGFETPLKIGNLFMNRFAVDEDAASEILKIFELEKDPDWKSSLEKQQKGTDLIVIIDHLFSGL